MTEGELYGYKKDFTIDDAVANLKRHKEEFKHDFGWNTSTLQSLDMAIKILEKYRAIEQIVDSITTRISHDIGFRRIKKIVKDEEEHDV